MKQIDSKYDEWSFVMKYMTILANPRSKQHSSAIKTLLDYFYVGEQSMTEDENLQYADIYDAWLSIALASISEALEDEMYEYIPIIEKAVKLQESIIRAYIDNYYIAGDEKDELDDWLDNTMDYFNITKLKLVTKTK